MKISFLPLADPQGGAVAAGVLEGGGLTASAVRLDTITGGAVKRALERSRFAGRRGQTLEIVAPAGGLSRILLVGLGKPQDFDALAAEAVGGAAVARLLTSGETKLSFAIDVPKQAKANDAQIAAHLVLGARLRAYRFDRYRTRLKPDDKPSLGEIAVMSADVAGAKKAWKAAEGIAAGIYLARDLVSEPANALYPEEFVRRARMLTKLGVEIEVLGVKQMQALGMGALLGVAQGSAKEPRLLVMKWNGGGKAKPVALVGKGVCFDSGGISLKPGEGMWDMKWDMAGAGAVAGAMYAIAARKAKANVVALCALVENMPDGNAQRPGDIVTSMSGQTIEVLNTDAEGRLILADAVWYAQDRFKPVAMVDVATLTGAIMIALGKDTAGVFANDDTVADRVAAAAKEEGEPVWRLPLTDRHDKAIDSPAADMKNISGNRDAGSSIGAAFIKRFVNNVPWAHIDIAGTAWVHEDFNTCPKGASGYGVRLLNRFVASYE